MVMKQLLALAALPAWLFARPGAIVYTSTGEGDSPTTPICTSVESYYKYPTETAGCAERPAGVKVVIETIVPATKYLSGVAKVRAKSGAFSGYTAVDDLLPPIPAGVAITLAPGANETLTISSNQSAALGAGLKLGAHTSAVTVRFDPASDEKRDLLVRVTSGKYAGKTGWLFARQAFIGDSPINVLKL
jgi:hypothetical protein